MKTILEILQLSTEYLRSKGIQSPRREAEDLLASALGIERMQLYLEFDRPLIESEISQCRGKIARRGKREPFQYIQGQIEFYQCQIRITQDVLIPRPETEILVDQIAQQLSGLTLKGQVLWDVCTGSGCIGIALKKRFPELEVCLSDLSPKALALAEENAQRNDVKVSCVLGDLLTPFKEARAHYIACNPPYIAEREFASLQEEVRNYEPKMALVAGASGLEFYERLKRDLPNFLHPSGKVWLEIGHGQGESIKDLFQQSPWKSSELRQDWSGHDRFFSLEIE